MRSAFLVLVALGLASLPGAITSSAVSPSASSPSAVSNGSRGAAIGAAGAAEDDPPPEPASCPLCGGDLRLHRARLTALLQAQSSLVGVALVAGVGVR